MNLHIKITAIRKYTHTQREKEREREREGERERRGEREGERGNKPSTQCPHLSLFSLCTQNCLEKTTPYIYEMGKTQSGAQ